MTHPFLPQRGREFLILERRRQRGIDILVYQEAPGLARRFIPVAWTNLAAPDPWVDLSDDRSPFRLPDLLRLASLLRELACQGDSAGGVKMILPKSGDGPRKRSR